MNYVLLNKIAANAIKIAAIFIALVPKKNTPPNSFNYTNIGMIFKDKHNFEERSLYHIPLSFLASRRY